MFKTPHETLKFQEKCILQQSADLYCKRFSLWCLPWVHPKMVSIEDGVELAIRGLEVYPHESEERFIQAA